MLFGLAGASGTFQREMNRVLKPHSEYAQAYMDDVVILSKTFKEHLVHLKSVISELEKLGLSVRLDKCSFAAKRIKYLGHVIGKGKHGAKVEIISDNNPFKVYGYLKYLNQTTPKSPKLTRWALALQRWNHSITHRPGVQLRSADALSRLR
ncbi:retrovirus-related Pol polyprotein from transposon 297 [Nephila pilipes]|uniref:Retrovirus-related Pol polyprotein from transposon 297 n=1 Tax=Nephila pilipes TaxID=299642 RepID=A0A8X6UN69_NEPPI|nr:retrovirus-related Pol polyprotein from transposon 297 [Nephila pilipes]